MLKTGSLLLSSCWKHYGLLMHLEDHIFSQRHKELLDQYLSGIQVAVRTPSFVLTIIVEQFLKIILVGCLGAWQCNIFCFRDIKF